LEIALRKTKPSGYITGDDYGVVEWWDNGVTKAVDEFAKSKIVRLIEIRNRQFVLKKLPDDKLA